MRYKIVILFTFAFFLFNACKNGGQNNQKGTTDNDNTELTGGTNENSEVGRTVELNETQDNLKPFSDGKLFYRIWNKEERTMTVVGATPNCSVVEIPTYAILNGEKYSVISVSKDAFINNHSITSVDIPTSILFIGEYSFAGSTVESASIGCGTIMPNAFEQCNKLTDLSFYEGVVHIHNEAFTRCESLLSITFPNSLQEIGRRSFRGLTKLENLSLGNGIIKIGEEAFVGCIALRHVDFGSSLQEIGNGAFSSCQNLESVELPNCIKTISHTAFVGCSSITIVNLPDGLKTIGPLAFLKCKDLLTAIIPASVDSIGNGAFEQCTSLKKVKLSYGIKEIPDICFSECDSLKEIDIPSSVKTIGEYAFSRSGLRKITIPEGVTYIKKGAFYYCPLKEVTIPSSLQRIEGMAFSGCDSIKNIYSIAEHAPEIIGDGINSFRLSRVAVLHVPASAITSYSESKSWNEFRNVEPLNNQ